MSEYFVGSTGANNQTNFSSLDTSEVLDDLGLNTGDSPIFSGLFLEGSGSTIFSVDGSNGRLFGVTDEVTGTVFSVNDAAGLPIIEVESTSSYDKLTLGEYGSDLLVLSGQNTIEITGSQIASQSWVGQQGFVTSETDDQNLNEVLAQGNTSSYGISVNQITGTALTIDTDTLFVDSTNDRVGIGTNNPSNTLDIAGGLEVNAEAYIRSTNNVGLRIQTTDQGITGTDGLRVGLNATHAFVWQYENLPLAFATNGSQKATILANGNFGIGNAAPSYKLDVNGDFRVVNAATFSAGTYFDQYLYHAGDTDTFIRFQTNDINLTAAGQNMLRVDGNSAQKTVVVNEVGIDVDFRVEGSGEANALFVRGSDGNVGIGTASANNPLTVSKDAGGHAISYFNSLNADGYGVLIRTADTGNDKYVLNLESNSGNTSVMYASNAGNVGIGTTSPAAKLQVYSTATSNIFISGHGTSAQNNWAGEHAFFVNAGNGIIVGKANANNDTNRLYTFYNDAQGNAEQYIYNTSNVATIKLDSAGDTYFNGGNVGIGTTSPSSKLEVVEATANTAARITVDSASWDASLSLKNANGTWEIINDYTGAGTTGALAFWNGSYRMAIDNTGNVGIGTNAPATRLDVYKSTSTSGGSTGTPLLRLHNYVGSDLGQQKTFIDFTLTDDNGNETPQVRIGAEVGQNGDANTQAKEGCGAFVVYTNNADTDSGDAGASLAERMRVDYQGNVGIGRTDPSSKLHVAGEIRIDDDVKIAGDVLRFTNDAASAYIQSADALILEADYDADDTGGKPITFKTAGTTKMTIAGGGDVTINNDLTVSGDLTVNGTTSTINSTTLQVDDKNIELGTVATPTDTTADGGGITLKGATDKTINWVNSTGAWTFSEKVSVPADESVFGGSGNVPIYVRSTGTVSYIQIQNSSTGSSSTNDGLTVGCNGNAGYLWLREAANLNIGTNDTTAITISSSQNTTFAGSVTAPSLSLASLNAQNSENTALVINGSYEVGTRELGSAAFSATSDFAPAAGSTSIVSLGTVVQGDWNAGVISSTYLDADTAHLSGTQTFSGAKTFSSGLNISVSTSNTQLKLKRTGTATGEFNIYTNNDTLFFNNVGQASFPMVIDEDGNVGIGTTGPNSLLHVNGEAQFGATSYQGDMNGGKADLSVDCGGTSQVSWVGDYFQVGGTDLNYNMRATAGLIDTWSQDLTIRAGNTGTTSKLHLGTNGQTSTIVCNNGNVGIGTTSPEDQLDIVGQLRISNNKTADTNKTNRIRGEHYDIAEEPTTLMFMNNFSTVNALHIGGGSTVENAATSLNFYTAANNTTTQGSVALTINSSQNATFAGDLTVGGDTVLNGGLEFGGNIPAATTDTDTFLVVDSGALKYRTGAQVLSDIGGISSETVTTLALTSGSLVYTNESGTANSISLAAYLDEDSRSIASGSLNSTSGIVTFTRDDSTTFTLDLGPLLDDTNLVTSVAGKSGVVSLVKGDVGLGNVTNESKATMFASPSFTGITYITDTNDVPLRVRSSDGASMIGISDSNSTNDYANGIGVYGNALHLTTNGSEKVRIDASGNVGIGTTSPQQKLHVEGNIYLGPNNTNNFIHSGASLGIQADGEVKIVSDVNDTSGVGGVDIIFGYGSSTDTDSNQDFTESELGTYPRVEVMRIDTSANRIGILDSTPSYTLDVNGTFRTTSAAYFNNDIIVTNNATVSGDLTVSTDFAAGAAVNFSALANAGSDVDKFLVSDSGDVKFRTGSEVLSDIGGITDVGGKITKKISGDGTATTFAVTHSFGTPHVMTQLLHYGNNGTGATYEVVNATVKRNSDNAIDVIFGVAPTTTEDYLVLITKMPAIS